MRKFNLSLDDFSPRPDTNDIFWCNKIIDKYPNIKIDLFIPSAFARLKDPDPFYLSKYPEWVEKVKQLPNNYHINLHTHHHRRSRKDFKWHSGIESANNEWENLTYAQASELLDLVEGEFNKSGIKYSKVFRPSGWHIGFNAAKLLTDRGYIIAGDTKHYKVLKNKIPKMRWVFYNWDLINPCNIGGDIAAYGHLSNWTKNYMNENRFKIIDGLLNNEEFNFKFIEEML